MKKTVLLFMALMGALTVQADEVYPYLTFETTDGAKVSVNTSELTLSISGKTLTAGSQEFTLENLSKMYFSKSDESTTGIDSLEDASVKQEDVTAIYDLNGREVSTGGLSVSQLPRGVYVVKTKQGTFKLVLK